MGYLFNGLLSYLCNCLQWHKVRLVNLSDVLFCYRGFRLAAYIRMEGVWKYRNYRNYVGIS